MRWTVLLLLSSCLAALPAPRASADVLNGDVLQALSAGIPAGGLRVIVRLRPEQSGLSRAARQSAIAARQQRVLDRLPAGAWRLGYRYHNLDGFSGWADRAALDALATDPDVALVYRDGQVKAALHEGRPLVGGEPARIAGFDGAGVTVAVLDTGIDTDHPDLADDLVSQACFCDNAPGPKGCCPGGGQEEYGPGSAEDDDGHGTAVSGIVTADGVVVSRALAKAAGISAVKVLSATGGGAFSDIDMGLDWVLSNAATYGIRVVNLSLSDGNEYATSSGVPCGNSTTADAIAQLTAAGITVVVASGNDGYTAGISFPACVADAISVGGVYDAALGDVSWCGATCSTTLCEDLGTQADDFVCHTNSGSLLDVLAPDWKTHTTGLAGGSTNLGGTSAAAPYIAAEAALLYQADPSVTPAEVRTLLKSHGPLVTNPASGLQFRRSNVAGALTELIGGPDTDGDGVPDDGDGSGTAGDNPCKDGQVYLCDDNCPNDPNPTQADADGDRVGDACDDVCSNGLDDDGDGAVDYPDDVGCASPTDATETDPGLPCDDGIDNDGDGWIDTADPGCRDSTWTTENPACSDGIDNDGDGLIDYPDDPQCTAPWQGRESSKACGLGFELAFVLPLVQRGRRARRRR